MPDAGGNIKGIALNGRAGEVIERIFASKCKTCGDTKLVIAHSAEDYGVSFESEFCPDCVIICEECGDEPATDKINGADFCYNCWERGMGLD